MDPPSMPDPLDARSPRCPISDEQYTASIRVEIGDEQEPSNKKALPVSS